MTNHLKQVIVWCVALFFMALTSGCGESGKAPEKPAVVSQKVATPKPESAKPLAKTAPAAPTAASAPVETSAAPTSPASPVTVGAPSGAVVPAAPAQGPAMPRMGLEMGVAYGYNPENKVDPFIPLLQEKPPVEAEATKPARLKRIPRTPLERIDLGQLKLVAVLRLPGGNKALVEEANGKGYIIGSGTYIGTNEGIVKDILPDRIVVEEQIEDVMGNVTPRNKDLVLQKPLGE